MLSPAWAVGMAEGYVGDCREVLRSLRAASVHVCVTSPPYLGLRSYAGEQARVWGGDPDHAHVWGDEEPAAKADQVPQSLHNGRRVTNLEAVADGQRSGRGAFCPCGAWRGALGLEPTIALYVAHLVEVMREVRRVLHPTGTLWLNLGDSYSTRAVIRPSSHQGGLGFTNESIETDWREHSRNGRTRMPDQLPEKNLLMVPARVALALQDDGLILRSHIAWTKASAMPESVTDRPNSAWESIFLFAQQGRYFYDNEAVRVPGSAYTGLAGTFSRPNGKNTHTEVPGQAFIQHRDGREDRVPAGANLRNHWHLGPEPFPDAHFATFPTEIPRRAILAGTSARGVCPECGNPWARVVERGDPVLSGHARGNGGNHAQNGDRRDAATAAFMTRPVTRSAWVPTCDHGREPVPATVLDPFGGAGTTSLVASQLGRRSLYIDTSPEYAAMAEKRLRGQTPSLFAAMGVPVG